MTHSSLTAVQCLDNGHVGKQPVAWKEYCAEYWLKELLEGMDRCTGRRDITEILLKTALNTTQSIFKVRRFIMVPLTMVNPLPDNKILDWFKLKKKSDAILICIENEK